MRVRTECFALAMFDEHANLKHEFGNRSFWAEGYYVSTGGLNEARSRKTYRTRGISASRRASSASRNTRIRSRSRPLVVDYLSSSDLMRTTRRVIRRE